MLVESVVRGACVCVFNVGATIVHFCIDPIVSSYCPIVLHKEKELVARSWQ